MLKRTVAFFKVLGPGLMVMLADTDAGCLITAAQSGGIYNDSAPDCVNANFIYGTGDDCSARHRN
ncbi:hypothetical protein WR164_02120 [Philodulcilactobacillus myokoensis]|uniref:Uncharacterized protein n=1 Tax=Philodulcilactobacillus myokoensis TaxID=2929573 RepID=A0A9W6B047_9LACO|nr:hypothetical protein WR164_02120 [Philodulcilactobacillus myokoensis]